MEEGSSGAAICNYIHSLSEKEGIDDIMLVMGSRQLGFLKRTFLGSVSEYCVRHAPCPVSIVKHPLNAELQLDTDSSSDSVAEESIEGAGEALLAEESIEDAQQALLAE